MSGNAKAARNNTYMTNEERIKLRSPVDINIGYRAEPYDPIYFLSNILIS
jgi:hypothetical protein